jgi:putative oxidoreductase
MNGFWLSRKDKMKIAALVARILLGLLFAFAGLNGLFNFLKAPLPGGLAGQYVGAMVQSHYMIVVAALQFLGAVLLLVNRYVVLGLVILGPIIVNILLFHIFLEHMGLIFAIIVAILWCIAAYRYKQNFSPLFAQKA